MRGYAVSLDPRIILCLVLRFTLKGLANACYYNCLLPWCLRGAAETTRPEKWVRVLGPLGGLSRGSDFMYPTVGLTMGMYVGFRMRIILSDRII